MATCNNSDETISILLQSMKEKDELVQSLRLENEVLDSDKLWDEFESQAKMLKQLQLQNHKLTSRHRALQTQLQVVVESRDDAESQMRFRGAQVHTLKQVLQRMLLAGFVVEDDGNGVD